MNNKQKEIPGFKARIVFPLMGESPWRRKIDSLISERLRKSGFSEPKIPPFPPPPPPAPSRKEAIKTWIRKTFYTYKWRIGYLLAVATILLVVYWFFLHPLTSAIASASAANAMLQGLITVLVILVTIGIFHFTRLAETESELRRIRHKYESILFEPKKNKDDCLIINVKSEIRNLIQTELTKRSWHPCWGLFRLYIDILILYYHWFAHVRENVFMVEEIPKDLKDLGFDEKQSWEIYTVILNKHIWMSRDPTKFFSFLREIFFFASNYLPQEVESWTNKLINTIKMILKLDERFHADNIPDVIANIEKYRIWSGGHFRSVAVIVFAILVVEIFVSPIIESSKLAFGFFISLYIYALTALVFYILLIFYPREWALAPPP